jgi:PemK-like, MazF-like toxin of type II toxin-antitoxin system
LGQKRNGFGNPPKLCNTLCYKWGLNYESQCEAPLFRLQLNCTQANGLQKDSQIMVDKITTIKTEKIQHKIGNLSVHEMQALDNALKLWLNL